LKAAIIGCTSVSANVVYQVREPSFSAAAAIAASAAGGAAALLPPLAGAELAAAAEVAAAVELPAGAELPAVAAVEPELDPQAVRPRPSASAIGRTVRDLIRLAVIKVLSRGGRSAIAASRRMALRVAEHLIVVQHRT
jgi:hypothetical protein